MAFNKNKFCQELISNNVKLFENLEGFTATESILHIQKLNIINNPKIICDYIKDQYFKNVLSIKHKGLYLYNMLFKKNNKILWDYLFDETKMLFFIYRELQKRNDKYVFKTITPRRDFNILMKHIKQFFYQTAPNTEIGDHLTDLKNNAKDDIFHKWYLLVIHQRWIKKRKWTNKMKAHLSEGGFINWIKDFNDTFKNFNYIYLKGKTPQQGWIGYCQDNLKGTHFDYLFNLKKNCLVWDCNKDDFRKERINDFAIHYAYEEVAKYALLNEERTLDGCFDYIKKHFGNHCLYNVAKNNMERWWRNKHKCWLSNAKCSLCDCDIVIQSPTEPAAKLAVGCYGYCNACLNLKFPHRKIKKDESDSD